MSHWIKELGLEQTPRDHGAFIIRNDTEYNVSSKHALMRVYVCLTPPSFPPRITCCHFFSFPFLFAIVYTSPLPIYVYTSSPVNHPLRIAPNECIIALPPGLSLWCLKHA